jgi:hypothetical protein
MNPAVLSNSAYALAGTSISLAIWVICFTAFILFTRMYCKDRRLNLFQVMVFMLVWAALVVAGIVFPAMLNIWVLRQWHCGDPYATISCLLFCAGGIGSFVFYGRWLWKR